MAEGECTTCSIGFRAAGRDELAREVLQRAIDAADPDATGPLYRDPAQPATDTPASVPPALNAFAADAVQRLLRDPAALACALGEVLSEPKRGVWFDTAADDTGPARDAAEWLAIALDQRTRMLYDDRHVFINGESFRAAGRDARLMRRLADARRLGRADVMALGADARALVDEWLAAGWLQPVTN